MNWTIALAFGLWMVGGHLLTIWQFRRRGFSFRSALEKRFRVPFSSTFGEIVLLGILVLLTSVMLIVGISQLETSPRRGKAPLRTVFQISGDRHHVANVSTTRNRPPQSRGTVINVGHPNKHIREAIEYAEDHGWTFMPSKGHIYGTLWCPGGGRAGCRRTVYSTPKNPEDHAKDIRRAVDRCPHT